MIETKRAYDSAGESEQARFLVDRLWPRGVKKESLHVENWLKELAPSDNLRKWFGHDPAKWDEFQKRYFAELDRKSESESWQLLLQAARAKDVILLFGAHDIERNNAVALKAYLERHMKKFQNAKAPE